MTPASDVHWCFLFNLMHGHTKYHPAGSGAVGEVHVCCFSKVWHVPPALSDQLHPHFPALTTIVPVFLLLAGEASVSQDIDVGQEEEEEEEQAENKRPEPSTREIIGPLST